MKLAAEMSVCDVQSESKYKNLNLNTTGNVVESVVETVI